MVPIRYVLITGAAQGIGRALAYECAGNGMGLLLVDVNADGLYKVAEALQALQAVVHTFAVDLTADDSPERIKSWVESLQVPLYFLINNAGIGSSGWFEMQPAELYRKMIRLNNEANVLLTRALLPFLRCQSDSYILNVGSMESFLPLPYKNVYTGTKQFLYGFTLALREEVRSANVSVSLLGPGPVPTHPDGLARLKAQGRKGKLIALLPEEVARIAVRDTLRGKAVIVPGRMNRVIGNVMYVLPRAWRMRIMERLFRVYVQDTPMPGTRQR